MTHDQLRAEGSRVERERIVAWLEARGSRLQAGDGIRAATDDQAHFGRQLGALAEDLRQGLHIAESAMPDLFDASIPMITLWQPWASLVFMPATKLHETRSWKYPAKYQDERIAIHAAKTIPSDAVIGPQLLRFCEDRWGKDWLRSLPTGCVIGTVRLAACSATEMLRGHASANDLICGNWDDGRFAWRLADHEPLSEPVPAKGGQGWRRWTPVAP